MLSTKVVEKIEKGHLECFRNIINKANDRLDWQESRKVSNQG